MRSGYSLVELLVVIGVAGILLGVGLPPWLRFRDAVAVRQATHEVAMFYHVARHAAIRRATRVRIVFAADTLRATYEGASDSLFLVRPGPARHGVSLAVSRAVIRVAPNGFGYGAANTTLVLRRGTAADSLTTSRLGRLKRW